LKKEETYEVYLSRYIPDIGEALLIITGGELSKSIFSEYLLFIMNSGKVTRLAERLNYGSNKLIDSKFSIDDMKAMQKFAAEGALMNFIYSKLNLVSFAHIETSKLSESVENQIFRFYKEVDTREVFDSLRDQSKSQVLKQYIEKIHAISKYHEIIRSKF